MVIFGCIFVVDDNRDAELAFEIEEIFFFIADNDGDIADTCVLQLPNLSLNEDLTTLLLKGLWAFHTKWEQSGSKAPQQYHCVFNLIGMKRFVTAVG